MGLDRQPTFLNKLCSRYIAGEMLNEALQEALVIQDSLGIRALNAFQSLKELSKLRAFGTFPDDMEFIKESFFKSSLATLSYKHC